MFTSYRFIFVALVTVLTNSMALLGVTHESAGGIVRTLECRSALARNSELIQTTKPTGEPPPFTNRSQAADLGREQDSEMDGAV